MGICACSAGNHAQGVAFSASALDISVPWELRWSEVRIEKEQLPGNDSKAFRCVQCSSIFRATIQEPLTKWK